MTTNRILQLAASLSDQQVRKMERALGWSEICPRKSRISSQELWGNPFRNHYCADEGDEDWQRAANMKLAKIAAMDTGMTTWRVTNLGRTALRVRRIAIALSSV